MYTNHAARGHTCRTSFRAKTRAVGAIIFRQIRFAQNLPAMQVCHRRFGRGDEITFTKRLPVLPLLHGVCLIEKFRELPHTLHALGLHHERRAHFGIAVLVHVQVQQILDHRPFQARTPAGVEQKAATRQFGAPLEIDQAQGFA